VLLSANSPSIGEMARLADDAGAAERLSLQHQNTCIAIITTRDSRALATTSPSELYLRLRKMMT
jgi:hypothetical protein